MSSSVDEDRHTTRRASQLARTLSELRKPEAEAIAYSERGYSRAGIAKEIDSTQSTVKAYHEKAIALYGFEICETHVLDADIPDNLPEYERVEPTYYRDRPDGREWLDIVFRMGGKLPAEFVADVRKAAKSDDMYPLPPESE